MGDRRTVQESPFACNMIAFAPAERQEHIAAIAQVFGAVEEIQERSGYAFRLPSEASMILKLATSLPRSASVARSSAFRSISNPKGERSG